MKRKVSSPHLQDASPSKHSRPPKTWSFLYVFVLFPASLAVTHCGTRLRPNTPLRLDLDLFSRRQNNWHVAARPLPHWRPVGRG